MKRTLLAGAALASVLAASGAFAQDTGWYGAIDLGGHHQRGLETNDTDGNVPALTGNGLNFRAHTIDYAGFLRLGYRLAPHFRIEIEGGYRHGGLSGGGINDLASGPVFNGVNQGTDVQLCDSGDTTSCNTPPGYVDSITGMANALFDVLPESRFDPFIGGGVGFNRVKINTGGNLIGSATGNNAIGFGIDESQTKLAYQGIAGIAYRATDRRNIDLTYRYLSGARKA